MQFLIANMTCGGCAKNVARTIHSVDPAARITADPASRRVEIISDRPRAAFEAALAEAGYSVKSTT